MFSVYNIDAGTEEIMSRGEGEDRFGSVEFLEMADGYDPRYIVSPLYPED